MNADQTLLAAPLLLLPTPVYRDNVYVMDALALLRCLPSDSVDMALTSPPYDNLRTYKGYSWDFDGIAQETYRVLKPGGVLVWVVGDSVVDGSETLNSFKQALYFKDVVGFRAHDTMIYHKDAVFPETNRYYPCFEYMFIFSKGKPNTANLLTQPNKYGGQRIFKTQREADGRLIQGIGARLGRRLKDEGVMSNVWYLSSGFNKTTTDKVAYQHPAMFPEELARRHIATWSNPGDTVLDFFMGSGTTAKMARALGRHYIGCDISAEYVQLCNERLAIPFTIPLPLDTAPAPAVQGVLL